MIMTKNTIIVILAIVSIASILYGFTQSVEATRQRDEANRQRSIALTLQKNLVQAQAQAREAQILAEINMMEATRQQALAAKSSSKK
ncbi:hypothetical protein BH09BAC3_BH09BAC3_00110 [soil metagenome]